MAEPFLISPFFVNYILPFVLVFTLIFAILQKTKILGEGKKQIDAIVAAVIGLILIAYPDARNIVVLLMPFLAVSITILFVFLLFYAFTNNKDDEILSKGWKIVLSIIFALALLTAFLIITGWWGFVVDLFAHRNTILVNVIMIVIIVGAIIAVIRGDSKGSK